MEKIKYQNFAESPIDAKLLTEGMEAPGLGPQAGHVTTRLTVTAVGRGTGMLQMLVAAK